METLVPPFCPNGDCPEHRQAPGHTYVDYISWGSYSTMAFGSVPRFRCRICGATFSAQTFSVDYYCKKVLDYDDIARKLSSCESLSAIGRSLCSSTDSVSNRVARAARQVIAFESIVSNCRQPDEDLAADGFESFCVSQYFPNNIHILVGSRSQFLYALDHVTLRRKGRMTEGQRRRRAELDLVFRPDPRGIEKSFARVADETLTLLSDEARPSLRLWTDKKKDYPRGISRSPCAALCRSIGRLDHQTISSRAKRTKDNPLFPVNYLDREIRKDLHEHTRESVCFGRNVNLQMERLSLYAYWHNYRKRHRIRGGPESHAEVAGYDIDLVERYSIDLWKRRAWLSLVKLSETMRMTWLRERKNPLAERDSYLPAFAFA